MNELSDVSNEAKVTGFAGKSEESAEPGDVKTSKESLVQNDAKVPEPSLLTGEGGVSEITAVLGNTKPSYPYKELENILKHVNEIEMNGLDETIESIKDTYNTKDNVTAPYSKETQLYPRKELSSSNLYFIDCEYTLKVNIPPGSVYSAFCRDQMFEPKDREQYRWIFIPSSDRFDKNIKLDYRVYTYKENGKYIENKDVSVQSKHIRCPHYCFQKMESILKEQPSVVGICPRTYRPYVNVSYEFSNSAIKGVMLLNMSKITKENINFRPELRYMEDMIFSKECTNAGFEVCIWNAILFNDTYFSSTGANTPCQSPKVEMPTQNRGLSETKRELFKGDDL
ncbi:unnamed protein product [Mytilus edulis]|uniref:Uncharacterized protein n=1 Tax=Mytilus edulis TaxID=6550 RepID=A0A8S3V092_MYTED|nr:unnamed protein product [Mytilus edulis]